MSCTFLFLLFLSENEKIDVFLGYLNVGQLVGQPEHVAVVDHQVVLAVEDAHRHLNLRQVVDERFGRAVAPFVLLWPVVERLERLAGPVILQTNVDCLFIWFVSFSKFPLHAPLLETRNHPDPFSPSHPGYSSSRIWSAINCGFDHISLFFYLWTPEKDPALPGFNKALWPKSSGI